MLGHNLHTLGIQSVCGSLLAIWRFELELVSDTNQLKCFRF